jgi:hypothetical protein
VRHLEHDRFDAAQRIGRGLGSERFGRFATDRGIVQSGELDEHIDGTGDLDFADRLGRSITGRTMPVVRCIVIASTSSWRSSDGRSRCCIASSHGTLWRSSTAPSQYTTAPSNSIGAFRLRWVMRSTVPSRPFR